MNDRRNFLKTTAVAATVVAFGSSVPNAFALGRSKYKNVIFTHADPGRWKAVEGIHIPQVTITGAKVSVVTPHHPMTQEHYIVRHTLVLANGTFIGAKTFTPADKPESEYDLPAGYKGELYVTSFCNLHDFWLHEVKA